MGMSMPSTAQLEQQSGGQHLEGGLPLFKHQAIAKGVIRAHVKLGIEVGADLHRDHSG